MAVIKKIKLHNFKRFQNFSLELDEKINLFIGDNESGKSTILSAIDIVLSGSKTKVETVGLDSLFNLDVIQNFLMSTRKFSDLPQLCIELYLDEQNNPDLNGKINSDGIKCDGLSLVCEPNDLLSKEIEEILKQPEPNFPFEYYLITFKTFSGDSYTGYRKFLRHVLIDNSQISSEYATREFVRKMYESAVVDTEKNKHQNEYRKYKEDFRRKVLSDVNSRVSQNNYSFSIRSGSKSSLETDLTIAENEINIENKGKGRQAFIKTDFALKKKIKNRDLDVVLIEEPENHLSHVNMKKLIHGISRAENRQLFVATHSDLISTRLDLRKSILLNSNNVHPVLLSGLPVGTAKFFMKAPDNNVLKFILSKKVILVEGDAEYILMESFYKRVALENLEDSDIDVIAVGGTSFKRYLDIAKILQIKTAVIRDNDSDYQLNCVDNYSLYSEDYIRVFADKNPDRYTFEIALYQDNISVCDELFSSERRKLSVQEYMLKNKADVAFEILDRKGSEITPPDYIVEAIKWLKK